MPVYISYHQLDKVHHFYCAKQSSPTQRNCVCTCMKKIGFYRLSLPLVCILTTVFITLYPSSSWALQVHDAPEGLYVHQMAHILFMASLAYLSWDIHRNAFRSRGWTYLQLFCLFMFFWNGLAFAGHGTASHLSPSDFFTESTYLHTRLTGPFSFIKFTDYLVKFDHLLSVPALFFLFMALRTFYHSIETEESKGENE